MAMRALLHKSKLEEFRKWLEIHGYDILPIAKNSFEVLRAKKDKETVIVFCKLNVKEHLSVMDKDSSIVRRFIRENKR